MKFYQSGLEAVVWNPEKDCVLAEFKKPDYTFDTKDPIVIAKLKELGYQPLPEAVETVDGHDGPQVARLRS